MSALIDIQGQEFGRLTVTQRGASDKQGARWLCVCRCGAEVLVPAHKLRSGRTKSCGCLKADSERPQERVKRLSDVDTSTGCWIFRLRLDRLGYGRIKESGHGRVGNKITRAHRYSWESFNGKVPSGKYVLHRCDNRACVNPSHLFLGTHQDNMLDMYSKGRGRYGPNAPSSRQRRG